MTSTTPRSGMPLLAAAQAQKHVTHNQALVEIDALIGAAILDRDLSAPPSSPADGDCYLIKATATGAWSGQDGRLAYSLDGAWNFAAPFKGLTVYVSDETKLIFYDGAVWSDFASVVPLENIAMLGINTSADSTNKLAVKSSALLFDNIGNGVQAKLNKHAAGDTASLLYQTNYSGRAEFGLCGDDNFHMKVSPDGAAWTDAATIDRTSGAVTLAAGLKLPNASAAAPAVALNTNTGLFYDSTNSALGFSVAGAELGYLTSSMFRLALAGGTSTTISLQSEGNANNQIETYATGSATATYTLRKARGTIAAPTVAATNDVIGNINFQPYSASGSSGFSNSARLQAVVTETATLDASHLGSQLRIFACPIGSASLTEVARLDNEGGLSLFGANPVIDKNRAHRLRSTTIAGAVAPSVAGNLFYHSDAQGGAGEVAVDTSSAYRHAGQAAVRKLTTDADATYTPRADGRIVRDSAALSADRKLTLATTNVTDGHKVEVSRRGASGGHNRSVYQSDGTTLIATLADNANADFIYDATAALWFQK
ncbi:MAG: DUF2793 domain-containing protein [Alphaproteobacteria bacterium]|nr:DUF2793 domain-containing protein [Alphaproteobacteria bacterium]